MSGMSLSPGSGGLTLRRVSMSLSLLILLIMIRWRGLRYIARFLSRPSIQREQVMKASWLSHRGLAQVEEVCLSWRLHHIEVSIFPPSEIPKAVPRWIHFTPGNSFLSVWVHVRLTGRRRRHGTFKPPSNNGFVISQRTAASSQSQPLPFSNFISSAASLSLLVFLSVFPHRRRPPPPISLCFSNCLYLWQLQTLLAVIGYSSQPWNDPR